MNVVLIVNL